MGQAQAWAALGEISVRAGHPEDAIEYYEGAYQIFLQQDAPEQAAVPRAALGQLLRRSGKSFEALRVHREVCALIGSGGEHAAGAHLDLAGIHTDLGDWVSAEREIDLAERALQTPHQRAQLLYARSDWVMATGALRKARDVVDEATSLFDDLMDRRGQLAAKLASIRLGWRLGEVAPLPHQLTGTETPPDIRLAVDAVISERFFAMGRLQEARELISPLAKELESSFDGVRQLKAESFVEILDWMQGKIQSRNMNETILRISLDLSSRGNIREAVGVTLNPVPLLIFRSEWTQAESLLGTVKALESSQWPEGWSQALERYFNLLRLFREGALDQEPDLESSEDVDARILDALFQAIAHKKSDHIESILVKLETLQRSLWAGMIRKFFQANPKVLGA